MCGTISLQDVAASEYYERRLYMDNFLTPISIRDYNHADWKYEKILEQIHDFEATLDDDHEIALRLASFGTSITMIVKNVSYQNPDILYLYCLNHYFLNVIYRLSIWLLILKERLEWGSFLKSMNISY